MRETSPAPRTSTMTPRKEPSDEWPLPSELRAELITAIRAALASPPRIPIATAKVVRTGDWRNRKVKIFMAFNLSRCPAGLSESRGQDFEEVRREAQLPSNASISSTGSRTKRPVVGEKLLGGRKL